MWGKLINGLLGGGLGAVDGILGRFWKNKDALETNLHGETADVLAAYASEFTAERVNRTWWDSLVDGLNRLPRPAMALGVVGLMAWAPLDPLGFSRAMRAYALVPEWLAGTLFGIAAFYFTARHFEKRLEFKGPSRPEVARALADIQAMGEARPRGLSGTVDMDTPPMPETEFQAAMADDSEPLSNAAIAEWNRRRAAEGK